MIKTFKQILLNEKILIKRNKGYKITFNQKEDHLLKDKLNRSNISFNEFESILNKLTKKVKTDKLQDGNYVFIFNNFKLTVILKNKEIFITTILSKDMIPYKKDKIINIDESINYIIIDMRNI